MNEANMESAIIREFAGKVSYQAGAGADKVVKAGQGVLHAIIVGKDVTGGVIEVSDHVSDGGGNVKIYLADPAVGVYPVHVLFEDGITVDMTTQTNVSFIYS